jgi:histidine triad (HIT) family protein
MSCIFCDIASKKIKGSVVYEGDKVIAFNDIAPQAPVHVLIIPKEHVSGLSGLSGLYDEIFAAAEKIAAIKNVDKSGFRIVVNNGKDAGQAVEHMHFHLLGGRGLHWPPG